MKSDEDEIYYFACFKEGTILVSLSTFKEEKDDKLI